MPSARCTGGHQTGARVLRMRGALDVPLKSYGCGALSGVSFALPYDVADVVMSMLALTCMMFVTFCRTVLLAHGLLLCL